MALDDGSIESPPTASSLRIQRSIAQSVAAAPRGAMTNCLLLDQRLSPFANILCKLKAAADSTLSVKYRPLQHIRRWPSPSDESSTALSSVMIYDFAAAETTYVSKPGAASHLSLAAHVRSTPYTHCNKSVNLCDLVTRRALSHHRSLVRIACVGRRSSSV